MEPSLRIAYVRNTFPKNSETFILEEILALKRFGHDIRIFSKWCDLSHLNDKIVDNDLLSCVIYDIDTKMTHRKRWNIVQNFCKQWITSREHRNIFNKNFFQNADLKQEIFTLHRQQVRDFSWRASLVSRISMHADIWLSAMKFNNLSLARQQYVIRSKKFTPEHIHCPFLFMTDAIKLTRLNKEFPDVPHTVTLRSRDVYFNSDNARYLQLRDWLIYKAEQVFTISKYNKIELSGRFNIKHEMEVIHSSIDAELFTPDPKAVKRPNQFLSIARLVPKKGLELLIEACAFLHAEGHQFKLSIVGEGMLKKALLLRIEKLGLQEKVEIIGPFRQKKIKALLDSAEVFVLPCVVAADGDRDMLPNAIKEAMAMKLPVITTDISGIGELITDRVNGLLTRPNDAHDLAEKMAFAMADKRFSKDIGSAARERILEEFSISSEGKKFNAAILRINALRDATG